MIIVYGVGLKQYQQFLCFFSVSLRSLSSVLLTNSSQRSIDLDEAMSTHTALNYYFRTP